MKLIFTAIILVVAGAVGYQLYVLESERLEIKDQAESIIAEIDTLKQENEKLLKDIEYFSNFDNLVKEFKALFNYKKAGEKLIIIVPESR